MNKIIPILIAVFIIGCSPALKVSYDFDGSADFSSFRTFKFTDDALKLGINELMRMRLLDAITAELAKKGVTPSDNPDILIDLKGRIKTEREATAYNTGGYYGAGYRYGWGPGFSTTQINVNEYQVGTIFIDLIDAKTNHLVWQGRAERTLDESASTQTKEKRIKEGVADVFYNYPPKKK
jgi:hypothetical protein